MTSLQYFLLFLFIFTSFFSFIEIIKKEEKHLFIKILIIFTSLYFFLVYLPKSNNVFEILAFMQFLLLLLIPVSIFFVLMIYLNSLIKEKRYLDNFPIIVHYQPPSNLHPAIAGYLIDKKIGEREFFAAIFHAIIDGTLAIDEQVVDGKYKYYLIKNKGHEKSISCDRIVSDYIFFQVQDRKFLDSVSFEEIKINSGVLSKFITNELVRLKYFENPYCILKRSNVVTADLEKYKRKGIESIKKIYRSPWPLLTKSEKEHQKKFINKKINNFKYTIENTKRPRKIRAIKTLKQGYFLNKYRYTDLGAQERAKWLGFKDYLQTAERFRLDEEKVETFSKYLPYAIALGVETQWAKRFENMNVDRLKWFRSQKSESIKRHDNQKVYFKHLLKFLGQIYVK